MAELERDNVLTDTEKGITTKVSPAKTQAGKIEDLVRAPLVLLVAENEIIYKTISDEMGASSGYNKQYERDIRDGKYDDAFNARTVLIVIWLLKFNGQNVLKFQKQSRGSQCQPWFTSCW